MSEENAWGGQHESEEEAEEDGGDVLDYVFRDQVAAEYGAPEEPAEHSGDFSPMVVLDRREGKGAEEAAAAAGDLMGTYTSGKFTMPAGVGGALVLARVNPSS